MGRKSRYKHILVVRFSAMGDVAMVPHALRALRANYPDLKITVLTKALFAPLFEGLGVDILPADIGKGGRHDGIAGISRLAHEVKALGVDHVVDIHRVLRSTMLRRFLLFMGIGSTTLRKGRIEKWMHMDGGCNEATRPLSHTVLRYCDTLRRAGFEFDDPKPTTKSNRKNPTTHTKGAERWVGIAPFSVHKGKCYPIYHVQNLIEKLSEQYDRVFILSGGGEEQKFAQKMESVFENVESVFGKMSFEQELALISNLDCLISMDSYAMHAASLVATPVVSIWGATHPMLGFSGYGSDPRGVVQLDLKCRPCSTYGNKKCRFNDYHCLQGITPDMVLERVDLLLKS